MIETQQLWLLIPLLLATGAFAGVLAGLLGVGGGIVIVPILFHLFTGFGVAIPLAMPLAVGTSLSTIVLTSMVSARKHYAKGGVDMALVKTWILPILIGVVIGSLAPAVVDGAQVKSLFGIMLVTVSVHMLASSRWRLQLFGQLPPYAAQFLLAILVGGLSALLGIGGGTLMVPLLTLFAFPIHRAVSTASVFGLIISIPATLVYVSSGWGLSDLPPLTTGYVNWAAFAILVPMTMWFAPLGVKLAYRLNVPQLKRAFAVFLCLVGLKMVLI
jgi:uncharacterized membrane protein YfcA